MSDGSIGGFDVVRVCDGPIGVGKEKVEALNLPRFEAEREAGEWNEWALRAFKEGRHMYSTYHYEVRNHAG